MITLTAYKLLRIGAVGTIVILPLIVLPWVLYPFMFGKTLLLYTASLLLAVPFVALTIHDAVYRKRLSAVLREPLTIAVFAVLLIDLLSSIVGVDFDRSFFGDEERGMGLITETVIAWWFIALRTTIVTDVEWGRVWQWVAGSGVVVSCVALLRYAGVTLFGVDTGFRVSGTIANPIFFAGAMVFYAVSGFYAARYSQKKPLIWLWRVVGIAQIVMVFVSKTRGTTIGVLAAIVTCAFIAALVHKGVIQRAALSVIGVVALVFTMGFVFREQLQHIEGLNRLTSISLRESTVQSRIEAWKSGVSAFKERPLLGWGVENTAIALDAHYNPALLAAGYTETHFDRAHNIVIERLVTTGIFGLVAYVMLGVVALWYCVRTWRRDMYMGVAAVGALLAYYIHLMLAFDTSLTLLLLYLLCAFLAYVHHGSSSDSVPHKKLPWVTVGLTSILAVAGVYGGVVMPMQASSVLLHALVTSADVSRVKAIPQFELALTFPTVYPEELRVEYVKNILRILAERNMSPQTLRPLFDRAAELAQRNIDAHPRYSYYYFLLGLLYKEGAFIDVSFRDTAQTMFDNALRYSPKRQQYHFAKAEVYNEQEQFDKALEEYSLAYDDAPQVLLSQWYKGVTLLVLNRNKEAYDVLIPFAQRQYLPPSEDEQRFFATKLDGLKRYDLSAAYYMNFVERHPAQAGSWAQLAVVFKELKEYGNAYFAAAMSARLDGTFQEEFERFVTTLPQGSEQLPVTRTKLFEYEEKMMRVKDTAS